jgi:hypothetical protein
MRAAVVVVMLVGGCASRTPGRVVGGALTALGTGVLVKAVATDCPSARSEPSYPPVPPDLAPLGCGAGKLALGSVGVLTLAVGLTTLIVNESVARELPALPPANAEAADADDPELRQLIINAGVAARAGRCKSVETIADRIAALDPAFRHDGFLRDPAIAACVD